MIAEYRTAFAGYSRDIRLILSVSAILAFTVDGVFPVVFNLYILRMGYGPEFVGTVNSIALVAFALSSLMAGTLGMRYGARPVLILGVIIGGLATAALTLSDLMPRSLQPPWLIVMFSLLYLGAAFFFVNAAPALVSVTTGAERSRVISIQSALNNLLAFVGGPVAGFVPLALVALLGWSTHAPATYRVPLIISAGFFVVAALLILRVHVHPLESDDTQPEARSTARPGAPAVGVSFLSVLLVLSLIRFLTSFGIGAGLTFFNVYMDDALGVSTATIGIIIAVSHLLSVFSALTVPRIVARWGAANGAVAGSLAAGLTLLPMAIIPFWPIAGLSFITMGAISSIRYNTFFVYMMEATAPRYRTTMAGAGEFSGGMGFAIVSLVGGFTIVNLGYGALFVGAGLATMLGGTILWLYVLWRKAHDAEPIPLQPSLEPGDTPLAAEVAE
jgi:MFS family permease